ncbi:telomeric repeat-binding factor 2-interacting protein 1-like [Anneissia japonica]|nr:telomeric repeat-binding factor 2-interacting protein 1-like [Anneissia japonica]
MEGSSSEFSHSEVLFTKENGAPLNFYMRPCEQRVELRRLIEYGGGAVTSKIQPDTIRLYLTTDICFSDECYDSRYIRDCIKQGCLLDLKDYK